MGMPENAVITDLDSWGLRKLFSHGYRRWSNATCPRAPCPNLPSIFAIVNSRIHFALGPFMLAFKDPEMQGFWDILDDLWGQAEPIDTDPYVDSQSPEAAPGPVLAIQDLTVEEETGPLLAIEDITEPGPDQHSHVVMHSPLPPDSGIPASAKLKDSASQRQQRIELLRRHA